VVAGRVPTDQHRWAAPRGAGRTPRLPAVSLADACCPPVPLHRAPLLLHAPSMSRQHPRTPQHGWRWLDACRPLCCAMPSLPSFASADKDDTGSERSLAASARLSAPPCLPAVPMQASSAHSHACCAGSSLSRVLYVCATPPSLLRTSAPPAVAGACTTPSTPATPRAAAFNRALAAVTRRPPHPGPTGEAAADGGSPLSGGAGAGSGRGSPGTAWSLGSQQGSQQGSLPGSGSQPRRPPGPCVGCAAGHPQRLLAALAAALHDLRSEFAEGAPREIAGKKQTLLAWRHRQGAAREQRWGTGPHGTRSAHGQWSRRRRVLATLWGAGGCRQARSSARTGRECCEFCTAQCPHGCMRAREPFAGTAHAHKGFRGSAGSAASLHAPGGRKTVTKWPSCGSRLVSGLIGAARAGTPWNGSRLAGAGSLVLTGPGRPQWRGASTQARRSWRPGWAWVRWRRCASRRAVAPTAARCYSPTRCRPWSGCSRRARAAAPHAAACRFC